MLRSESCPDPCLEAFQGELDYLFASLRRLGVSPDDREDVAQEVFLALRGSWSKFEPHRRLRPYLFGIAFRVASAYRRKHGRHSHFALDDVLDWTPNPEEILQSVQTHGILAAALKMVPLPRRAALIMHHLDEVPVAEVARALSIPLFTAYSRLRLARRELEAAVRRIRAEEAQKRPSLRSQAPMDDRQFRHDLSFPVVRHMVEEPFGDRRLPVRRHVL